MDPYRDETELAGALRALRPALRPEFAANLDARVAAGFPRRGTTGAAPARLLARLRSVPPRRVLAPAVAVAVAAIVVSTAVVAISEDGGGTSTPAHAGRLGSAPTVSATGEAGERSSGGASATGVQFEDAVPSRTSPSSGTGPYASHTGGRDIERSARMVLSDDPSRVRADSAQVFEAVHTARGIVLRSTIRDGSAGDAGADFELLIPSARLGDALAAFSGIAEVRSRHESTQDITAPTIGVSERLQDSQARVESLLAELAGAQTEAERAPVEAELRAERRHAAALRSRLSTLQRRANLSRVSLRIETGGSAFSGGGAGWGVGDGFDAAGRILAVAAGIVVVGLAVLAPIAAIILLAWLAHAAWIRHSRTRALN